MLVNHLDTIELKVQIDNFAQLDDVGVCHKIIDRVDDKPDVAEFACIVSAEVCLSTSQ